MVSATCFELVLLRTCVSVLCAISPRQQPKCMSEKVNSFVKAILIYIFDLRYRKQNILNAVFNHKNKLILKNALNAEVLSLV